MRMLIDGNDGKTEALAAIRALDGKYIVEIKRHRKTRSTDQNNLYWGRLRCLSDCTGYTAEELHDLFRHEFLGEDRKMVLDKPLYTIKSTTTLDTKEFTAYIDKIKLYSAEEIGVYLPDPGEPDYDNFGAQYM